MVPVATSDENGAVPTAHDQNTETREDLPPTLTQQLETPPTTSTSVTSPVKSKNNVHPSPSGSDRCCTCSSNARCLSRFCQCAKSTRHCVDCLPISADKCENLQKIVSGARVTKAQSTGKFMASSVAQAASSSTAAAPSSATDGPPLSPAEYLREIEVRMMDQAINSMSLKEAASATALSIADAQRVIEMAKEGEKARQRSEKVQKELMAKNKRVVELTRQLQEAEQLAKKVNSPSKRKNTSEENKSHESEDKAQTKKAARTEERSSPSKDTSADENGSWPVGGADDRRGSRLVNDLGDERDRDRSRPNGGDGGRRYWRRKRESQSRSSRRSFQSRVCS